MTTTQDALTRRAVEAAAWAPSVHNTQPWSFGLGRDRIVVRADASRRLDVADPDGREMLISCGAALFTLETALRAHGLVPDVRSLPDPDRPNLVADVRVRPGAPGDETAARLLREVPHRRTHRGAFRTASIEPGVLAALHLEAELEGAHLRQAIDVHTVGALAALTQLAEHLRRLDPAHAAEAARWAPTPRSTRTDGVPHTAYPRETPRSTPDFAARDFARGQGWGVPAGPDETDLSPGLVFTLSTKGDTRADWLTAGRALQRVLLRAAADADLSAAFHTQALEIPELRAFVRTRFCAGDAPQMILRLGVPSGPELTSVRRPLDAVVFDEP
ncbi:Acg family FMN-binding oxidoreductase [Actinomadura rayongensis]|uniref:Nitroreductase n=1 Tax=Actinomadura rayongensis TaxID=1429076 RepID=A0A6I4W6I7_9ACTN|nr:hypothetical protein [Actinomadura rayongensis]MXQ64903.1 hypothetical protein [Actinomadura rayongensis]